MNNASDFGYSTEGQLPSTQRYQVATDGLTTKPRFSRRYAVVDTTRLGTDGEYLAILETDDGRRAADYAHECNLDAGLRDAEERAFRAGNED